MRSLYPELSDWRGPMASGAWLQADVTLDGDSGGLALIHCDLAGEVCRWRDQNVLRHFLFVHKPPGIRLRFSGPDAHLTDLVTNWLERAVPGLWAFGCYQPEALQFGGNEGMELAHEFFTAESVAVLRYRACQYRATARLDAFLFSLVLLDRCFRNLVEDEWELWEVWCHQKLTGRITQEDVVNPALGHAQLAELREEVLPLLRDRGYLRIRLSDEEAQLWQAYDDAVSRLAVRCGEAVRQRRFLWSLRQILPFWAVFHWNRMAFDGSVQHRLASLMVNALCPKW